MQGPVPSQPISDLQLANDVVCDTCGNSLLVDPAGRAAGNPVGSVTLHWAQCTACSPAPLRKLEVSQDGQGRLVPMARHD